MVSSYYRQWNNTVKASEWYTVADSYKRIQMVKGGLFRVTARCHTSTSSNSTMSVYEYRNGGQNYHYHRRGSGTSGYQCHSFDEIYSLKKDDYLNLYDNNGGTVNNADYQCFQIVAIPFPNRIGMWKSSAIYSTNQRVWNCEYWCSEMLFSLDDNKVQIEVKEDGHYRVHSHVTQYSASSTAGYSALFINGKEHAKARYAAHGSTYYHTTHIQEIVRLKKGDKIYIFVLHPYNSRDDNSLFMEKLY